MRVLFFLFLFSSLLGSLGYAGATPENSHNASQKTRLEQLMHLTGDEELADEQNAWDRTYLRSGYVFGKAPAEFLVKMMEHLPKGRSLDIATGEGRNAVYLAKKGFISEGVDISNVGLRKAQQLATENKVKIRTINADLNKYRIPAGTYDVILNFYYLQRSLIPQIKAGLKRGGVVVFETNTTEHLKNKGGADWSKDFLLNPGELKEAFAGFQILHYSETNDGTNAVASLVAKKP